MVKIICTNKYKELGKVTLLGQIGDLCLLEVPVVTPYLEFQVTTLSVSEFEEALFQLELDKCLELRVKAYAKLTQDELRFDDEMNGTKTWVEAILAIKAKYPKPVAPVIEEL